MAFNEQASNTDDHMRNHAFLLEGLHGWKLSPAFDLNPTPTTEKPRILTNHITIDNGTCSIELVLATAKNYGLCQSRAKEIILEVAEATCKWREVANRLKRPRKEIDLMSTAFENEDLKDALVS